jgi:hypothetical protein
MNKIQLRPPPPSPQIEQAGASLPCLVRQVESSIGYRIRDEELVFLNELLTLKRKVARTFAENGEGTGRRIAEVALEMRLLQASFYDFLREQIKARGGQAIAGSLGKRTFKEVHAKVDPDAGDLGRVPRPKRLVEVNQQAILKRSDAQLRVAAAAVQKLHHKTTERFKDLLT